MQLSEMHGVLRVKFFLAKQSRVDLAMPRMIVRIINLRCLSIKPSQLILFCKVVFYFASQSRRGREKVL